VNALAVAFLVLLFCGLAVAFLVALARSSAAPAPGPTIDPALLAFSRALKRPRFDHLAPGASRVEGRLRGERVSAQAWSSPWPGASSDLRAEVRLEAVVPVQLTETFVRGPTGQPRLSSDREPHPRLREAGPDLALRTLLKRVDEVKLGLSGLEARSREPLGEPSLRIVADALISLAGFVRTDPPPKPDPVARLIATRTRPADAVRGAESEGPRVVVRGPQVCPFCRDGIDADAQDAVACEGCATLHHGECWAENGRCTVRGCEQVRAGPVPDL
jgi:hypothetical protein